jgi:hypothetical protein
MSGDVDNIESEELNCWAAQLLVAVKDRVLNCRGAQISGMKCRSASVLDLSADAPIFKSAAYV